jgi:hypothetical protein
MFFRGMLRKETETNYILAIATVIFMLHFYEESFV